MELKKIEYSYSEIESRKGTEYDKFMNDISKLQNMVYFLCKDGKCINVRCTKNSFKKRLFQDEPKVFESDDFKISNGIYAIILDGEADTKKLEVIRDDFINYFHLDKIDDEFERR